MEGDVVKGSVEMSAQDFWEATTEVPAVRNVLAFILVASIVWAPVGVALTLAGSSTLGLALALGLPTFTVMVRRMMWRGAVQQTEALGGDRRIRYTIDATRLTIVTAGARAEQRHDSLQSVLETRSAFLFKVSPQIFNVVPKRAFAADDLPRIRELLSDAPQAPREIWGGLRLVVVWLLLIVVFLVVWQLLSPNTPVVR